VTATIRHATEADLDRITEIYDQYVVDSHVSFDTEPWSLERRREWWASYQGRVLVAERDGGVVGTAFAGPYRHKRAYASTVETTIVLDSAATGTGLGTALLGALVELLRDQGMHRAIAIIALPNDASVAVHRKLGYREVGTLDEVGFKMGRYWSTMIMELHL
jgi:phosphinothricin acetyltransferase